jgi:SAM-dependent methyltransferase
VSSFDHVADEYDHIATEYRESKQLPFRRHVEEHTTFGLLPNLAGRSVVDLACGEGIYTRKLRRLGADRVVGVDISTEMIALARQSEIAEPIGVAYVVADVATVEVGDPFDVAFCSYLFNYARSRTELRALLENVARLLRPGGVVVGCNDYPDNPPLHYERYLPYGFAKRGSPEPTEGSTITYRFFNPDGTVFELDNYFLPSEAYLSEFEAAGFEGFSWVPPDVSPEGRAAFADGYWDAYLESPPIVSFTARRRAPATAD